MLFRQPKGIIIIDDCFSIENGLENDEVFQ